MTLKLYKIDARTNPNFIEQALQAAQNLIPWDQYNGLSPGAKIAVNVAGGVVVAGGAVVAAPAEVAALAGAGAGAIVLAGLTAVSWLFGGENVLTVIDNAKDLKKFTPYDGTEFINGAYYIGHPKDPNVLVLASGFHTAMIDEQMQDIIAFYRSVFPVSRIAIEISDSKKVEVDVNATTGKGIKASGKAKFRESRSFRIAEEYDRPQIVPLDGPLRWIDQFRAILQGAKRATGGSTKFEMDHDLSFGLKGDLAKLVGVGSSWESNFTLSIDVRFASV